MGSRIRSAIVAAVLMTAVTGVIYPFAMLLLARLFFPNQARGSLIGHGSELIGQPFASPAHFWGRPSATSPAPYNAASSAGSNLAAGNPALRKAMNSAAGVLRAADPGNARPIPIDLVTASGSGLDPHISPAAARWQAARVARARGLSEAQVIAVVDSVTEGPQLGFLGEARVNVVKLNLALDRRYPPRAAP